MFDELVLMDDPTPRDGALNMAIDEALLINFAASGSAARPILRIYRWSEPWASLGYFEPLVTARQAFLGQRLVRRWTGGGLVPHGDDLTYSLLVPAALVRADWKANEYYNRIHAAVAAAMQSAGLLEVTLRINSTTQRIPPGEKSSHECFGNPVTHDIMLGTRKIAGAAQRKTRFGMLHQGSIQGLAQPGVGKVKFGPGTMLHTETCARLPAALARVSTIPRQLTTEELTQAAGLSTTRYGTSEWLEKF